MEAHQEDGSGPPPAFSNPHGGPHLKRPAMTMKQHSKSQVWRFTVQCFFGGIGLAVLTFVCFQLKLNLATTGFAFLMLIAVLSLMGSFIESFVVSIMAVGLLNYFFAQPLFSFRVEYPQDILAVMAFLTTSVIVSTLTLKMRKVVDDAQASQKALVDTIPALVWSAFPDGSRDFYSRRWLEFTGLSAQAASAEGWVVHPEDRAVVQDKWRAAIATGKPFEVEARGRSANGEYRWFLVRAEPLRDEAGAIVKWYGTNTDIEDRKRATDALRESEEQWREVFEHNPVMYFMIDSAGTVLSLNTFGAAHLGYTVDELVGQTVFNVFFEEDRQFMQRNVAVCLERVGQSHSWEVRKIRKDGTVIWVRENAKAVRRAGNRVIVLIACEDITESKRAENALQHARAELARVNRLTILGELTAVIAHEVNQPLTGLVSSGNACLHWLASDPPKLESARNSIQRMIDNAARAGEVISSIRAMVKKSLPRTDLLNINNAIMEVISLIEIEAQRNRVALQTELSNETPLVLGDRIQLQQVIINLLMNAIEAMSGSDQTQRYVLVGSRKDASGGALVEVRDLGVGLEGNAPDRLFDAFYTTKPDGMGMGLAVSRTIIEAHGGKLWASPNVPKGATFQFRLPADGDEAL
jgi:PAS domain S-box-containing protein